jgi:hypothetical protein
MLILVAAAVGLLLVGCTAPAAEVPWGNETDGTYEMTFARVAGDCGERLRQRVTFVTDPFGGSSVAGPCHGDVTVEGTIVEFTIACPWESARGKFEMTDDGESGEGQYLTTRATGCVGEYRAQIARVR